MKKRSFLLGLIFSILTLSLPAQIVTEYEVGFESSGENYSYSVTGNAAEVSNVHSSGSKAMKLTQSSSEVILETDTIDCTDNGSYHYFFLEFMHINNVLASTAQIADMVSIVEYRLPESANPAWHQAVANQYDRTWGGGSEDFQSTFSFSRQSYSVWQTDAVDNTMWKKERFNFSTILDGTALLSRKIQFRFRLMPRTASGATTDGWYIDGITFKVSPQSMAQPIIAMQTYPDLMDYPNSRVARIDARVTTSAAQGICPDSVYLEYMLGHTDVRRAYMVSLGNDVYRGYVPFCGYDTIVSWRLVAKDATTNHNTATFPVDAASWNQFRFVRGVSAMNALATEGLTNSNAYPFSSDGITRSQFLYSSAQLHAAGYGPGSITKLLYTAASTLNNAPRERMHITMTNMESSYSVTQSVGQTNMYLDRGKVVYDSSYTITQNSGTVGTINLQDTFFYAGQDILVTFTMIGTHDSPAFSLKMAPTEDNKLTINNGFPAQLAFDPFTNNLYKKGDTYGTHPNFVFVQSENLPLVYDCGVSGFITPNDSTSADAQSNNNVVLTLKNYGASPINAVRLWYQVDNGIPQSYDWSGTLAANSTVNVTVSTTQQYSPGYHEMLAWVDDSVSVGSDLFRDHEPLNDTCWTKFVGCAGPMSGVRYVGGSTPDYASLDKCLFALSQCGVDGPLVVKLAPGYYEPTVFPAIPGSSASNYVQFEPNSGSVTFRPAVGSGVASYLISLQNTKHVRFNGINFVGYSMPDTYYPYNRTTYLARLGINSSDCQFLNCSFREEIGSSQNTMSNTFTSALIYSGGADSLVVDHCTFYRGTVGISLVGPASDDLAVGNKIIGSTFDYPQTSAVVVRNQSAALVDSNRMNDVMTNTSYVILIQDCYGATRITRNKVFASTGASCIGATDFHGSPSDYAIVANNMLICADEGTSNMLVTPLNIITADYAKIVYNSVKMTAPERAGIAAATLGGGVINQCHFYNNIVSCFDTSNFAFNYIPNTGNINYIGYNIYYSQGSVLNKFNSINCPSLANWQSHYSDPNSLSVNPAFLGGTFMDMDLRSYSQNVKAHGVAIPEVSNDLFNTPRDPATPCIGAFEFSALPYDFEITEMLEPYNEYCNVPASSPITLVIKNSGVNDFNPDNMYLVIWYTRNMPAGQLSPTNSGSIPVNRIIPGDDTIHLHSTIPLQFPTNGIYDSTYKFTFWLQSTIDPNPANDTSSFSVVSHYHYPAPDSITVNTGYATTVSITPTGKQTWYPDVFTSGRTHQSSIYWYSDPYSTTPFYIGDTYTTETLYSDTLFYIRQRRDLPLVKISEVQIKQANVQGVTYPMPLWMNAQTSLAVELTNIGDYPADLTGDTLMTISNTSGINNKIYVLPHVTIQPHACLVVQFKTGINNVDSTKTLGAGISVSPAYGNNFAILYRDGNGVADAVAFNDMVTGASSVTTNWVNANVPATVWSGAGISLNQWNAGAYRLLWPTNNSSSTNTANYWQLADSVHFMTLGTVNQNLIRFSDNGCEGDYAVARVHLTNLPDVDLDLDSLNIASGCGLGVEDVMVTIRNRGAMNSGTFNVYLSVNDTILCVDTIVDGLNFNGSVNHQFSQPVNFYSPAGERLFDVKVWVDHLNADQSLFNDTTATLVSSSYTPAAPVVTPSITIPYASTVTLQTITPSSDSLLWYDADMNALDTVNVYESDPMFVTDTFYVTAFGPVLNPIHVGAFENVNGASAYPSPYNPNKKYAKEQYMYTAEQLRAAGHSAGPINAVSFHLDTILAPAGSMTFTDYNVSIGSTDAVAFTANNSWQTVTQCYHADALTLTNANRGWVRHEFSTPFIWDGNSSIVVQICRTINPNIAQGAKVHYSNGGSNMALYKNDGSSSVESFTGNGSRSANRPDILFDFIDYGCEGPASPVEVIVEGTPQVDFSLDWPAGNDTVSVSSCGPAELNVMLHNGGLAPASGYTIDYWIDNVHGVYSGTNTIDANAYVMVAIDTPSFTPGRHHIRAAVSIPGDTVPINDTIETIISVSFCAGTYTIGPASNMDYHSFAEAIDTLNNAGVAGPIVFAVQTGTYQEQLNLGPVRGSSGMNTITFRSASGFRDDVVLQYATTNGANYVLNLSNASNFIFEKMTFYSAGAQNYANVVTMDNAETIHFNDAHIHVKGTVNNQNASCMVLGENVKYIYLDSCKLDSGYYSIKSNVAAPGLNTGLYVTDCELTNFLSQGVCLRKVNDVYLRHNQIISGVGVNSRALTGIFVAEHNGGIDIEHNNVVLSDTKNGGKRGIHLVNCSGSNALRGKVYDNMVAINGNGTSGLVPGGIWIDSCVYMNVYFNSVRLYSGANAQTSRAVTTETTSSFIYLLNNIFSNYSKGYAVYVKNPINVSMANYNAYYSNDTLKFAYWGVDGLKNLDTLKMANGMDVNSTEDAPYFVSETDLHLSFGVYSERAQYNTEVPSDIDGEIRPQIPSPCIGADEPERPIHDICVMDIIEPNIEVNYLSTLIEGDTLVIAVKLYNDGSSVETGARWSARLFSYPDTLPYSISLGLFTQPRVIAEHPAHSAVFDTAFIVLPVGIYDTNWVRVVYDRGAGNPDAVPRNDTAWSKFYIDPAFNLEATAAMVDVGDGCRLHNAPVTITVTNKGRKTIPAYFQLSIGYQAVLGNTANVSSVAQFPIVHEEPYTMTADIEPLVSQNFTFQTPANLYPTNIAKDIQVKVRSWCTLQYDHRQANDTSIYTLLTSKYTPSSPIGTDLRIPYATWDTIFASQTDNPPSAQAIHRPIRWNRDTLAEPYYAPSAYAASCWWETPQYFHDSIYYLSCISSSGCTSYYNPVNVYLNTRVNVDASIQAVEEPYSKVFMNNDTVKVRIINYGTQPLTNIPVVYQLFSNNNVLLQEVHETCHATIQPDDTYLFSFDSLVNTPTMNTTYKLRCWTDLANEQVRLNDTIRSLHVFQTLPENTYQNPLLANSEGIDITRVSFSSLDHLTPEVGNNYVNFGSFNNPAVEPLKMIKGTTDTIYIETANSDDHSDNHTGVFLTGFIDYNRNGEFETHEIIFADTTTALQTKKFVYTYPDDLQIFDTVSMTYKPVCLGYMRMRICASQNGGSPAQGIPDFEFGEVQDYLLYIEDRPAEVNVTPSRIISPRSNFVTEDSTTVVFMLTNKGSQTVTSAIIDYAFVDDSCTAATALGSMEWNGTLEPGQGVPVALPTRHLITGTTNVRITVNVPGDTIFADDTLHYQYHRFKVVTLILNDNFENADIWFAPRGYNEYSKNVWERGLTHKVNLVASHSDSTVWGTNLVGLVNHSGRGNLSYLYTPVIDISQIRPDTIDFWLATDMSEDCYVNLEFIDYLNRWQIVGSPNDTLWYNDGAGFVGSTSGYSYEHYRFSTNSISGDFQQRIQFRLVFRAKPSSNPCDGAVVDDFRIGRAQRSVDVGVIQITHPVHPKFGQTIYPKAVIKNFGYDTIYSVDLAYRPFGSNLPKVGTWASEDGLAPGETVVYTFEDPFIVMNNFPDTFVICAYTTVNTDIYWENDSTCKDFYLSPLDNDMGMCEFIYPLDHIVAGDSIEVCTRIRNFGQAPVETATVNYIYNNVFNVTETINFPEVLGHPLESFEYFNYTFHQKCRASMGVMHLTSYVEMPDDDYLYNDTITKSLVGISNITDLRAAAVVVDASRLNETYIQLQIDNIGALAANDFEVGFWYDLDTNTMVRETFHRDLPLAALHTAYYLFDSILPQRPNNGYDYVNAYVHVIGDNDRSNDTTNFIDTPYVDLRPIRMLVEENREETCRVRLEVENIGNLTFSGKLSRKATINGQTIANTGTQLPIIQIAPGQIYELEFTQTISKDHTRHYEGSAELINPNQDRNSENNQTTALDVINYFNIPEVEQLDGISLDQNYPNPFIDETGISFHIPSAGTVRFFVMDELGRLVYQSTDEYASGNNSIIFRDAHLSSGVYYYGIEFDGKKLMRKMVYKN